MIVCDVQPVAPISSSSKSLKQAIRTICEICCCEILLKPLTNGIKNNQIGKRRNRYTQFDNPRQF